MSITEMYHYFFYKIYKSMDNEVFHLWADLRATLLMMTFEILSIFSLIMYFTTFTKITIGESLLAIILSITLVFTVTLKYLNFIRKDKYREIIAIYDAWPARKNFVGTLIVWGIVILLIVNFIYSAIIFDGAFG